MVGAKMTASELADLIGMCGDGGYNQDAATMLRQQQAEIDALKDKLYLAKQSLDIVDGWIGKAQEK